MDIKFLGDAETLHPSLRSQLIQINKKHFAFPTFLLLQADWWWFAYVNGEVASIAGGNDEDGDTVFLGPCGVLPQFRRRGIQAAMIATREEWARNQGFTVAVSCTGVENYASANNFIRAGYCITPPWKPFNNPDVGLFFRKQL